MKRLYTLLFVLLIWQGANAQSFNVLPDDSRIRYSGRTSVNADSVMLSWSGNGFAVNFDGTGISAVLKDENGINTYNVIIDGAVYKKITIDREKRLYDLASNLTGGKHNMQLFKLTEWAMGKTWFYGLNTANDTCILKAPAVKKRKIEFYGNSITCGYAVLDTTGKDRGSAPYEDNYKSYAAITAKHFDAEYSCIAKSGIGLLVSWFPLIMPEMYDRVDANNADLLWDFTKYTPDVVVINLFQNDSWIMLQPQNAQYQARFGSKAPTAEQIIKAYEAFVKTIRSKYPKAKIICALGSMDATREGSVWPVYVQQAVRNLGDKGIYSMMFPFKKTSGHPSEPEQKVMASQLIKFIEENVKW